uniref:Uncharacterized protein n=1 Tax=Globodera rostochiensis TaxID=31243 RepID=A0A914HBJ5_GLORO
MFISSLPLYVFLNIFNFLILHSCIHCIVFIFFHLLFRHVHLHPFILPSCLLEHLHVFLNIFNLTLFCLSFTSPMFSFHLHIPSCSSTSVHPAAILLEYLQLDLLLFSTHFQLCSASSIIHLHPNSGPARLCQEGSASHFLPSYFTSIFICPPSTPVRSVLMLHNHGIQHYWHTSPQINPKSFSGGQTQQPTRHDPPAPSGVSWAWPKKQEAHHTDHVAAPQGPDRIAKRLMNHNQTIYKTSNAMATSSTSWSSSSSCSSSSVGSLFMLLMLALLAQLARADVCQCGPRCKLYTHELHCSRCCTSVMKRRSLPFLNYPAEQIDALQAAHPKLFGQRRALTEELLSQLVGEEQEMNKELQQQPEPEQLQLVVTIEESSNTQKNALLKLTAEASAKPKPEHQQHFRLGHLLRSQRPFRLALDGATQPREVQAVPAPKWRTTETNQQHQQEAEEELA